MSEVNPSAGTASSARAPGSKEAASARSNAGYAEHAGSGAGNRHPDGAVGEAGDEHADDGEPRCRVGEFAVAGREAGVGKPHLDDQLALFQRGLEHAGEEAAGRDPPPGRDDLRVERQHRRRDSRRRGRCWLASRRWSPGCAPADRRSRRQARRALGILSLTDGEAATAACRVIARTGERRGLDGNAGQAADRGQVDQIRRRRETVLHHRDQAHPAGQRTPVPILGEDLSRPRQGCPGGDSARGASALRHRRRTLEDQQPRCSGSRCSGRYCPPARRARLPRRWPRRGGSCRARS